MKTKIIPFDLKVVKTTGNILFLKIVYPFLKHDNSPLSGTSYHMLYEM